MFDDEHIAGTCCGWPRRIVAVTMTDDTLAIATCDVCGRRQWLRNGQPVSSEEVIGRKAKEDTTREAIEAARHSG